jgi:hypothetical protein
VAKNLGGWFYLARKLVKLVGLILVGSGVVLTYLGFGTTVPDGFEGEWLYDMIGTMPYMPVLTYICDG